MPLNSNKLEKPFSKLSKLLKNLPKQPSPEQVHDVRTRTRRVEAALHALLLDQKRIGQRSIKALTPVRKRAGKVRDMDVLMGFASTLSSESDNECLVQLLEHLGHQRFQGARKLHKTVSRERNLATQSLKRCSSSIRRGLNGNKGRDHWPANATSIALQLSRELASWPKLNSENIHPFRLKVKELRYVLQLSGESGDLIDRLGEVKDTVGEWHDWTELANIAEEVLQHSGKCDVLEQIRSGARERFNHALELANRLRGQYFTQSRSKNKRAVRAPSVKEPVLKASARLAA
jgi:CHAD domain-containing protein